MHTKNSSVVIYPKGGEGVIEVTVTDMEIPTAKKVHAILVISDVHRLILLGPGGLLE